MLLYFASFYLLYYYTDSIVPLIADYFRLKMGWSAIALLSPAMSILQMRAGLGCGRLSLGKIVQLLIGSVAL